MENFYVRFENISKFARNGWKRIKSSLMTAEQLEKTQEFGPEKKIGGLRLKHSNQQYAEYFWNPGEQMTDIENRVSRMCRLKFRYLNPKAAEILVMWEERENCSTPESDEPLAIIDQ